MAAILARSALARLPLLLAASCLGTGAALLGGRALLERTPPLTPATETHTLERVRRWSPDPERRREASLLLEAGSQVRNDPGERRRLLRGQ
jgi:soluble lytic murein transglycosylase